MNLIILSLLAILIAGFLSLMRLPASFTITRRLLIHTDTPRIYAHVQDLKTWPRWSPWLIYEPHAKIEFSSNTTEVGSWYSWNGRLVGVGKILTRELSPNAISHHLKFERTIKASYRTHWRFAPTPEGTEVSWIVEGDLPLLLRWIGKRIDTIIGPDLELGLKRLALNCGDQSAALKIDFIDRGKTQALSGISQHYRGSITHLRAAITETMDALAKSVQQHDFQVIDAPICLYHKYDLKKDWVEIEIVMPLNPDSVKNGETLTKVPARFVSRVCLQGSHEHLPQAWHAALVHAKVKNLNVAKNAPKVERYVTTPDKAEPADVETWIELPLR